MGPGITLVVLGAILAFAVRKDSPTVDIQTVGLIFMLAGAAIIAYARRERRAERIVRHVEHGDPTEPGAVHETVRHEVLTEEDPDTFDAHPHGYDHGRGPRRAF
ncbi:MAG TPA: DUF6458 family protein [Nocardioidaceae bacterium]